MSRTITFGKLWSAHRRQISRLNDAEYTADLTTKLINRIWKYDWRETLGDLPPFYLLPQKQDYGKPIYAVPSDFAAIRKATLVRVSDGQTANSSSSQTVTPVYKPLKIQGRLTPTQATGVIDTIGYDPATKSFRIFGILSQGATLNEWIVEGVYKRLPQTNLYDADTIVGAPRLASEITGSNFMSCLLPIADRWYDMMSEVACALAKKQEAPTKEAYAMDQYVDGLIHAAAMEENVDVGTSYVSPDEPLTELVSSYWPY
jgi:hypothetical protein